MTYVPVRDGQLAAVVTFLEMRAAPGDRPLEDCPLRLKPLINPSPEAYRTLFRRVGSRWLWFSRLIMDDAQLSAIIADPAIEIFAVADETGDDVGLVELDFRDSGQCELAFIGLVPELAGRGHGRGLLAAALARAWRPGVSRVHVHTCSLDHPAALAAYRRAGFTAIKRAIEHFPDPRLIGILPLDCAPQVPLVGAPASATPPAT